MMNVGVFGKGTLLSDIHKIYTITVYCKCQYKYKKKSLDKAFPE